MTTPRPEDFGVEAAPGAGGVIVRCPTCDPKGTAGIFGAATVGQIHAVITAHLTVVHDGWMEEGVWVDELTYAKPQCVCACEDCERAHRPRPDQSASAPRAHVRSAAELRGFPELAVDIAELPPAERKAALGRHELWARAIGLMAPAKPPFAAHVHADSPHRWGEDETLGKVCG